MLELVPGVVFTIQLSIAPLSSITIVPTLAFDEPTIKELPGLVTVKTPLDKSKLSQDELANTVILVVPDPSVTFDTSVSSLKTKSLVAAIAGIAMTNNNNTFDSRI